LPDELVHAALDVVDGRHHARSLRGRVVAWCSPM
jgi:hypothetical protein